MSVQPFPEECRHLVKRLGLRPCLAVLEARDLAGADRGVNVMIPSPYAENAWTGVHLAGHCFIVEAVERLIAAQHVGQPFMRERPHIRFQSADQPLRGRDVWQVRLHWARLV